jgi:hypothetical protein
MADEGVKLATINRGPNCELRLRWKTFKGFPFLDIREWSVNSSNSQWFPTKGKGVTIKPRELTEVLAALQVASGLADDGAPKR